jgi:hypothetical protein
MFPSVLVKTEPALDGRILIRSFPDVHLKFLTVVDEFGKAMRYRTSPVSPFKIRNAELGGEVSVSTIPMSPWELTV